MHFKSKAPPIPNTCTSKGNLEDEISYYGKSQYLCGNTVLQSILGLTVNKGMDELRSLPSFPSFSVINAQVADRKAKEMANVRNKENVKNIGIKKM